MAGIQVKPVAVTRSRLLGVLEELECRREHYYTLYLAWPLLCGGDGILKDASGPFVDQVRETLASEPVSRAMQTYATGAVAFWSNDDRRVLVIPPFEVASEGVFEGPPYVTPLAELLERERTVEVVMVTWGAYALGVFEGGHLAQSKTGTGYIHKRHRKGGRSEKRFARRTEEQKKDFLRRVANRVDETFAGYRSEQVFFGGNRFILDLLTGESRHLRSNRQRVSKRRLHVRVADRSALLGSIEEINRAVMFDLSERRE
ncbi:MAG: Vms1/Ankzf1 family peptidyl-tRNA hydrolase [Chloroflexota bacterium]|nr:Vms1/Ankzf1 family peptidyl-tRNA hydrolase [Chloroflexota bacterium]